MNGYHRRSGRLADCCYALSDAPTGLLTSFRRDKKRDFASGSGAELLASKVLEALMTEGATPR